MQHGSKQSDKANDTKSAKADEQGATSSINDRSAMECRDRAVEFALALHRGKDKPAVEIVREASIIARYIHEGAVSPVPDAVPVAPAGVMVPPG